MHILLFGKGGQVGWELQRSLSALGHVTALDFDSVATHQGQALCGDFTQPERVAQTVRWLAPDVVVNAAAHTAVDKAQSEPELARLINASTPGLLAQAAQGVGAWLLHYSTDYVFDGSGQAAWTEDAATAPLNVYGQTKREGELAIAQSGCAHTILRTSWVYGARGGNFAKTMLKLAQERDLLQVIDDQVGAPTGADLLADVSAQIIARLAWSGALRRSGNGSASQASAQASPAASHPLSGLYHCTAAGHTTWHDYARHVLASAAQLRPDLAWRAQLKAVPTSAFPTPAQRPHNSRLDCRKLQATFGLQLPDWQAGVTRMLSEHLQQL